MRWPSSSASRVLSLTWRHIGSTENVDVFEPWDHPLRGIPLYLVVHGPHVTDRAEVGEAWLQLATLSGGCWWSLEVITMLKMLGKWKSK